MNDVSELITLLEKTGITSEKLILMLAEEKLSPLDVKRLFKAISDIRAGKSPDKKGFGSGLKNILSKLRRESFDLDVLAWNARLNEGPFDVFKRDKTPIEPSELMSMWQSRGRPSDIEEIVSILKDSGFSDREIKKAFSTTGIDTSSGSDMKITKLAKAIKGTNLDKYVVDYLERAHNITESVLLEKKLSDTEIKSVLVKMSGQTPDAPDRSQERQSNKNLHNYVNKWIADLEKISSVKDSNFKPEVGDQLIASDQANYTFNGNLWVKGNSGRGQVGKKEIQAELNDKFNKDKAATASQTKTKSRKDSLKEILSMLADRHGSTEWEKLARQVKSAIAKHYTPYQSEMINKMIDNGRVVESVSRPISESHIYRFLNFLEPDKGLGRRKKK